jgi:hypothetical protein
MKMAEFPIQPRNDARSRASPVCSPTWRNRLWFHRAPSGASAGPTSGRWRAPPGGRSRLGRFGWSGGKRSPVMPSPTARSPLRTRSPPPPPSSSTTACPWRPGPASGTAFVALGRPSPRTRRRCSGWIPPAARAWRGGSSAAGAGKNMPTGVGGRQVGARGYGNKPPKVSGVNLGPNFLFFGPNPLMLLWLNGLAPARSGPAVAGSGRICLGLDVWPEAVEVAPLIHGRSTYTKF